MDTILGNPLYIMMFIILGFIAIAVVAWHYFGHALKAKLKGAEKYSALIIKQGPNLERKNLEVEANHYLVDRENRKAWFLMGIQHKPNGELAGVLLSEDSCIPQFPGVDVDFVGLCEKIKENHKYVELGHCQLEIEKTHRESHNAPLANWLGITGLAAILGILVIGTIILLTSGLMPWGG